MTPHRHVRVLEIVGLGPAPFAAMMLADAGAEVVRVARPGDPGYSAGILDRGRPTVEANLKDPPDLAYVDSSTGPTCCSRASVPASWNDSASDRRSASHATRDSCTDG